MTDCRLSFAIKKSLPQLSARIGEVSFTRPDSTQITISTPGLIVSTSRGVVPHISRDHNKQCQSLRWIHVPFESFLDQRPPVPTLVGGETPLHRFLGYMPEKHLISTSLRDPNDTKEMPPNGKDFVSATCVRGVRKVSPADWRSYTESCKPDIVFAMTDNTPTSSQKRITKAIERSTTWLVSILAPPRPHPNVFVSMAGGAVPAARKAFADTLVEQLYAKDAEMVRPLERLDEGIAGYAFDLEPLRSTDSFVPLLHASLAPLPSTKPRLVFSAKSPLEMLLLIRDVGVDLFDSHWVQEAADIGVALDFTFPAALTRGGEKIPLGHNLYDTAYAQDFSTLGGGCWCLACAPIAPTRRLLHSCVDEGEVVDGGTVLPGSTKAYLHHLLHTHEMSAHTLLVMHNLAVLDAFLDGVRGVIRDGDFEKEMERFGRVYDGERDILEAARQVWMEVDLARGKGRLKREKQEIQV